MDSDHIEEFGYNHDGTSNTHAWGNSLEAASGIRDADISWHAKLAAYTLISRASLTLEGGWSCFTSLKRLAEDCDISRRQVSRAIKELRDGGLIDWYSGNSHGWTNSYTLNYLAMMGHRKPAKKRNP